MIIELGNGKSINFRQLQAADAEALFNYFQNLSSESRSRFGPHAFDRDPVFTICNNPTPGLKRYISIDVSDECFVAYMLIQYGMIEGDAIRYASRNHFFDVATTVTFAPSVADDWQSRGLGTQLNNYIEKELIKTGIKTIVLWGGVQATNEKAIHFYKKNGYVYIDSFYYDGNNNYDMIKNL